MERMASALSIAGIGALVGDPARANILSALMGGEALTAGELAWHARVTAQTASGHLARLVDGGLLAPTRQGRHRYYRLASPLVARMLESVALVASVDGPARHRPGSPRDAALRAARTCYDHLAGRLGVALADALSAGGHLELDEDAGRLTPRGEALLAEFGVDLVPPGRTRRCLCRPCLDWSERRPHLAGLVGARIAERCFALGWIERMRDTRAVAVTAAGARGFEERFGVPLTPARAAA
jgi:DNA-binding transcriptional ArsR family regulator